VTGTATPALAPTPVACAERMPDSDDLLTHITRDFGLSRDYEPEHLVPLSDFFPHSVTLGYPTEVSAVIIEPLQQTIEAMQADGLAPQIVSGYRSYSAQTLARQKWLVQYPDWAHSLSAPPGHSEHQLGTTIDFGSPELEYMLGEAYVQFHPAFAQTSEGTWLAEHAPEFGFTMSYPEGAFEQTTFHYEPWHFRYVGRELALSLAANGLTISQYLAQNQPIPCLTD
jgi:zinc D-Ala-D-Ala carboxypeptidase